MVWGGGSTWRHFTIARKWCTNFAAIGPEAGAIAEGSGGGDEPFATSSKNTTSMACRRSGADKMIDFMCVFVSIS